MGPPATGRGIRCFGKWKTVMVRLKVTTSRWGSSRLWRRVYGRGHRSWFRYLRKRNMQSYPTTRRRVLCRLCESFCQTLLRYYNWWWHSNSAANTESFSIWPRGSFENLVDHPISIMECWRQSGTPTSIKWPCQCNRPCNANSGRPLLWVERWPFLALKVIMLGAIFTSLYVLVVNINVPTCANVRPAALGLNFNSDSCECCLAWGW